MTPIQFSDYQKRKLPPGGGGGDNDGMDARMTTVESRLAGVVVKLDHIDKEVSGLKWWLLGGLLTVIVTTVFTVIGTSIGIQQMTVATFQAASGQQTQAPQPIVITVPAATKP